MNAHKIITYSGYIIKQIKRMLFYIDFLFHTRRALAARPSFFFGKLHPLSLHIPCSFFFAAI